MSEDDEPEPNVHPHTYKDRNAVERGYARIKQWRRIATRYDEHARVFLAGVLLAASVIYLMTRPWSGCWEEPFNDSSEQLLCLCGLLSVPARVAEEDEED